jgi:hypothetical protein
VHGIYVINFYRHRASSTVSPHLHRVSGEVPLESKTQVLGFVDSMRQIRVEDKLWKKHFTEGKPAFRGQPLTLCWKTPLPPLLFLGILA